MIDTYAVSRKMHVTSRRISGELGRGVTSRASRGGRQDTSLPVETDKML